MFTLFNICVFLGKVANQNQLNKIWGDTQFSSTETRMQFLRTSIQVAPK